MQTSLLFCMKSMIENLSSVQTSILDHAVNHGFDDDSQFCIRLALDEAIINAIIHGNRNDGQKEIYITARFNESAVCITVRDEGEGFDQAKLFDPREEPYLHQPHGRGIFLIREFTKEVQFNQKGNEITFTIARHVSPSAVPSS